MRNLNVLKYRKLLIEIQQALSKERYYIIKSKKSLTDFERGELQGQRKAYKKVSKYLHLCIEYADLDWERIDNQIRGNEDFE